MADPDDTVRIVRPITPAAKRGGASWALAGVLAVAVAIAGGTWFAWPTPPARVAGVVQLATDPPLPPLPSLGESDILARAPGVTEVYRFASQTEIVVLNFANFAEQADMLNRLAALIEKLGYPHDRILPVDELNARIVAGGEKPETFYYGHDYRAADVLRFFDLLDRSGQAPTAGETALRHLTETWGWRPGINGALISLVQAGVQAGMQPAVLQAGTAITLTPAERATILRHELSHGLYFTSPAYARYAAGFFATTMASAERARFTAFLADEGYDTTLDDLVVNETQAYLMHTAAATFFTPQAVGIASARIDELRGLFLTGMPPGWLRDCTGQPAR